MDSKLLHILQTKEVPIDNEQIIDYLKGALPTEQQQNIEQQALENEMLQDALEGLETIRDKARLQQMAWDINKQLQKKLTHQKHKRRQQSKWKDQNWLMLAVAVLVAIVVVCFIVIKALKQ